MIVIMNKTPIIDARNPHYWKDAKGECGEGASEEWETERQRWW